MSGGRLRLIPASSLTPWLGQARDECADEDARSRRKLWLAIPNPTPTIRNLARAQVQPNPSIGAFPVWQNGIVWSGGCVAHPFGFSNVAGHLSWVPRIGLWIFVAFLRRSEAMRVQRLLGYAASGVLALVLLSIVLIVVAADQDGTVAGSPAAADGRVAKPSGVM